MPVCLQKIFALVRKVTRDRIHSHCVCTMVQVCVAVHTRGSLFLVKTGLDAHSKQAGDVSATFLWEETGCMGMRTKTKATAPHNPGIAKGVLTPKSLCDSGY